MGKFIYVYVIRVGFDIYMNVLIVLVDMYGKCKVVGIVRLIFDVMEFKSVVIWNFMIDGYV